MDAVITTLCIRPVIQDADGELMTGGAIAKAVLDYLKELAIDDTSEEVGIPIRHADGSAEPRSC
jgi:hypothetical protein